MNRNDKLLIWPWNKLVKPQKPTGEIVELPDEVRGRHGVILGHPGMGKTRLIEWLLINDVIRRMEGYASRGWCFLDPHGDASDALISRIALLTQVYPELSRLVIVIDPTRFDWTVGFNPFEPISSDDKPERIARRFADAIISVFDDDPLLAVRLYRIVEYSALTLTLAGGFVSDIPRVLTDPAYRSERLARIHHEEARRFWEEEFPKYANAAIERSESTLNRIDRLVQDPDVRAVFAGRSTINFRQAMDEGCFIIIRCPRGKLTKDTSSLLLSVFT
jgi:hypothetical protein